MGKKKNAPVEEVAKEVVAVGTIRVDLAEKGEDVTVTENVNDEEAVTENKVFEVHGDAVAEKVGEEYVRVETESGKEDEENPKEEPTDNNSHVKIDFELTEVEMNGGTFMSANVKGEVIYLPKEHVVIENECYFIPLWLYKIKFK